MADLLILGASTRSAAFSALRAGLSPACADLFGDLDLTLACPATRIEPTAYPDGLATFAASLPPTPWLYTGALENRPDLVDSIALRHPLLGNPGTTLKKVRDPIGLAALLRSEGLALPEVRHDPSGLPADGSWLSKPIASAGGHGIRPWKGEQVRSGYCYQERIEGLPLAAIFVGQGGRSRLAGITRQFLTSTGHRRKYAYRGSLGPWPVSDRVAVEIERIGVVLASEFDLTGIFGVDLILADDRAWTIEVNPRYTASVEALEWATGRSLLAEHLRACGHKTPDRPHPRSPGRFVAKAILRAICPSRWPEGVASGPFDPESFPEVADVPHPGTAFAAGEPVATVFASADTSDACRRHLAARLHAWRARLDPES